MQELWFYAGAGRKAKGPCSREQLLALRAKGDVWSDTLVWKAGTEAWLPFADCALADLPIPPPAPIAVAAPVIVRVDDGGAMPIAESVHAKVEPEPAVVVPLSPMDEPQPETPASRTIDGETEPLSAEPVATPDETEPAIAVGIDYGVQSPRSFRNGGGPRPVMAASGPPDQPVDDDGWQYSKPVMWRRYFARLLDTIVLGSLIWFMLATVFVAFIPGLFEMLYGPANVLNNMVTKTVLTFLLVIPAEAFILGMTGTTAGKWLFGVRVTRTDGDAIGFLHALRREGRVFVQGLALGIPLFSMIAMVIAFFRVKEGAAGWDVDKPWVVTARPPGVAQTLMFIAGIVVVSVTFVGLQLLVAAGKR